ncbi:hypothetical protein EM20IM_02565 [Candidatus Methylacidiphilum infernorum]|uniref:Uncharacterized protein n=1 Tax=Candidatus Methylacidiphilum infernorum TaxID=511746 RepID=A0ABX7PWZ7_9BACT|nr:hypothetical protein [Candidatus Methylacidiphilum infernorum]QSR87239.1 hypothetical protein EM20IM_02565 [Candidatus Methylacidiphilum infernorum]
MDFEGISQNPPGYPFRFPSQGNPIDGSIPKRSFPKKIGPRNTLPPHLLAQNKKHPPPRKLGSPPKDGLFKEPLAPSPSTAKPYFPNGHSPLSPKEHISPREKANPNPSPLILERTTRKNHPPPKNTSSVSLTPKEAKKASGFSSRRKWVGLLLRLFLYVGTLAAGFGGYYSFRETRISGWIAVKGISMPKEIYLVHDFSGDVKALRENYLNEIGPCLEEIQNKRENLKKARTDITALNERLRLLKQQEHVAETEIQIVAKEYQEKADHIWKNEGALLDQEYDKKLEELKERFQQKAQQLGIDLNISSAEANSPEAWVNAYNLALYNPPPEIDPVKERQWAEEELKKWHSFETENEKKRTELKLKTKEIQSELGPKVQALREQILRIQSRIQDSQLEIAPLEQEYANNERELAQAEETERKIKERFLNDLEKIPQNSIREKIPLGPDGHFEWRRLDQNPKFTPGQYFLWVAIKKEGKEWWSLFPFPIHAYALTEIVVLPESFVPIDALLN